MKPISKNKENTIFIEDISSKHIVVGITSYGSPVILTNSMYEGGDYRFTCINDQFSERNSYNSNSSIQELVERYLENGWNIEVFHEDNWKEALKWLINNSK